MTSTHTPGPWRQSTIASNAIVAGPEDFSPYYAGDLICESVRERNRPLIIAAPELLAALTSAVARLDKIADSLTRSKVQWLDVIDAGRIAIAKATGAAP